MVAIDQWPSKAGRKSHHDAGAEFGGKMIDVSPVDEDAFEPVRETDWIHSVQHRGFRQLTCDIKAEA